MFNGWAFLTDVTGALADGGLQKQDTGSISGGFWSSGGHGRFSALHWVDRGSSSEMGVGGSAYRILIWLLPPAQVATV